MGTASDRADFIELQELTEEQAHSRLASEGYNELPALKPQSIFSIAYQVAREPMFMLLAGCGTIYLVLGSVSEAIMLLGFVCVIMAITFFQKRKTERALEALRDMSSPRALVVRSGREIRIPGREVVRGDIIILSEGDRIPADAVLLTCTNLYVDESLLTGEAAPVRKAVKTVADWKRPGGDGLPFVYSGSLVVHGQGIARVVATGARSEIGKIGKVLREIEPEETHLQREIGSVVRNISIYAFTLSALVAVAFGAIWGTWLHGFLAGLTLAMAILPEEFPVVFTIFLALGGLRMSKRNVLTRRVPAIETLGATTVLCVDKTGTITQNRMTVGMLYADGGFYTPAGPGVLPERFHQLVEFGMLAGMKNPFDPMEKALKEFAEKTLSLTEHIHHDWQLVREYPLSEELLAMSNVWKSPDGSEFIIAVKGAPETVVDLCHLDENQTHSIIEKIVDMSGQGYRVLGVAKAYFTLASLPPGQHDFNFEFIGLIGLSDPVRLGVQESVRLCKEAGIRIVMVTGDYPGTAKNVARQIGLSSENCLTGREIEEADEVTLARLMRTVSICARVMPEQKLRIVNALKANREVVAMTGDGINDAPALKAAHIGIAMGGRGTDVAREAADLVLTDDDFSSIVDAIRTGRRIYDNLKKAITYILAIHVPIAGMSLIPVFFGLPLVLMPVHIVFLELIIDPACSIVFEAEPEEKDVMRRRPRNLEEPMLSRNVMLFSFLQGLVVLLFVFLVFQFSLDTHSRGAARALTFTTLVVANICLILTNRSWSRTIFSMFVVPNRAQWYVSGGAILFLCLILSNPALRSLFSFDRLDLSDVLICVLVGVGSILWFEGMKLFRMHRSRARAPLESSGE